MRVFELEGLGALRTRFDVSRARGFSLRRPRRRDGDARGRARAQRSAGDGQVVGVVAEAGAGKSRLCFEFVERCRARGFAVIRGARRRARQARCRSCRCSSSSAPTSASPSSDSDRSRAREDRRPPAAARRAPPRGRCRCSSTSSASPIPSGRRPPWTRRRGSAQLCSPSCAMMRARRPARRAGDPAVRGPALDRRRRARRSCAARRRLRRRRAACSGQLPARVPARVDADVVLPAAAADAARRGGDARAARATCSAPIRASPASPSCDPRSAPAAIRSSSRRSCSRWSRRGQLAGTRGAYRLVRPVERARGAGDGAGGARGAHRSAGRAREAAAADRRR